MNIPRLPKAGALAAAPAAAWSVSTDGLSALLQTASDFVLRLNKTGTILEVQINSDSLTRDLESAGSQDWVGSDWPDTVTVESRQKVVSLLRDVASSSSGSMAKAIGWRHINYTMKAGSSSYDLPLNVTAVRADDLGTIFVLGRDLRATAALQQQLVDTQQTMERDYLRLRFMEARYRAMLQTAERGLAVIDAVSLRVQEANETAWQLLDGNSKKRTSKTFVEYFEIDARAQITSWLGRLGTGVAQVPPLTVTLRQRDESVRLQASVLRQQEGLVYLVWVDTISVAVAPSLVSERGLMLLDVVESIPDAFVVTNADGKVLTANAAFVEMSQMATLEHVRGERLSRWLSRAEIDLSMLTNSLRQHRSFRQVVTDIRGEYGSMTTAEISGVSVQADGAACFGYLIRDVSRRANGESVSPRMMPRSVDELKELVGRVSLKDIVGETTDLIEQLCIEAALELTGDNRAAASEMLGLSRQSLYVKLRRFGASDAADMSDSADIHQPR